MKNELSIQKFLQYAANCGFKVTTTPCNLYTLYVSDDLIISFKNVNKDNIEATFNNIEASKVVASSATIVAILYNMPALLPVAEMYEEKEGDFPVVESYNHICEIEEENESLKEAMSEIESNARCMADENFDDRKLFLDCNNSQF